MVIMRDINIGDIII